MLKHGGTEHTKFCFMSLLCDLSASVIQSLLFVVDHEPKTDH